MVLLESVLRESQEEARFAHTFIYIQGTWIADYYEFEQEVVVVGHLLTQWFLRFYYYYKLIYVIKSVIYQETSTHSK